MVIPSIRLDPDGIIDSLRMDVPHGVDLRYYIVSDNPVMKSCEFEYKGTPVRVIVNKDNLGASLSRNVGMDAGSGTYVLFIDDDVNASQDILDAYIVAIKEAPDAPGYVGPTIFPDPINSFTHGIIKSGMLHFFGRPMFSNTMAWGTTSNLMVLRSAADGIRFSAKFPRHGGGEDIDFCLRIVNTTGKWFKTVPAAPVYHPWWRNGGRSYTRFFRWSVGDSRLLRLHPKYAYRDAPNMSESLTFGCIAFTCASLAGVVHPAAVGIWAGLVILSEFVGERRRVRIVYPRASVRDGIESALIRLSSEVGKFLSPLRRGHFSNFFMRFDFTCTGEVVEFERSLARLKFVLFSASVPVAYWLGVALELVWI